MDAESSLGHGLQEETLQNASGAEGRDGRRELQTKLEFLVHFPPKKARNTKDSYRYKSLHRGHRGLKLDDSLRL